VIGSIEVVTGTLSIGEGVGFLPTPANAAGDALLAVGAFELGSGLHSVNEAAAGEGYDLGPPLKPVEPLITTDLNFNFISVGQSSVTLFGRNTSTGSAMFNGGQGWLPIGQAPVDVRWAPNSGTGNWQADQATKNYLFGGGENFGEGSHPVTFDLM
jgi:hypothetical protein